MNRTGRIDAKLIHVSGFMDFLNPAIQNLVGNASLIIFQRNIINSQSYDSMEYWQGMGKPVVVDLDDAYHILPWSNPAHKFWLENENSQAIYALEEGIRRSDGLLAPNRLLLSDWAHVARGYFLQNYAEGKWWTGLKSRDVVKKERGLPKRSIVIGWGGSISHYDSFWGSGIMEAAKDISERYSNVIWMICGNDTRVYDQLPVPASRKIFQEGVPPEQWPQIVKTFDIGIAPLFGPYDQRRSWIKGMENLLAGNPWIATEGEPYKDLSGLGYIIPNGADSWATTIEKVIKNLREEQKVAAGRVEMAQQWIADNQMDTYERVFGEIINDFMAKRGRLPGVYYVRPEQNGKEPKPEQQANEVVVA